MFGFKLLTPRENLQAEREHMELLELRAIIDTVLQETRGFRPPKGCDRVGGLIALSSAFEFKQ